jgi:hypothetical protein
MLKTFVLGLSLAASAATAASAGMLAAPVNSGDQQIVRVAEHCGAGWYAYGPDKRCHRFNTSFGTNRGTVIACPPGMHIGPEGHYCWPN